MQATHIVDIGIAHNDCRYQFVHFLFVVESYTVDTGQNNYL
jgi:hypothetical protein